MKKISLIVGNEFGDNLNEWLSMEGFETSRLNYNNFHEDSRSPDIFICAEEDLLSFNSEDFTHLTNKKPCIILGEDKAMAPQWLQKYSFLKMPFSFEELLAIILVCKPLMYS